VVGKDDSKESCSLSDCVCEVESLCVCAFDSVRFSSVSSDFKSWFSVCSVRIVLVRMSSHWGDNGRCQQPGLGEHMLDISDKLCPFIVCDGCMFACVDSSMKNEVLYIFVAGNVLKPMNKVINCET